MSKTEEQDEFDVLRAADACWNAVVAYTLQLARKDNDDAIAFLQNWNEGEFDVLREEWPDAPAEIYQADPLSD